MRYKEYLDTSKDIICMIHLDAMPGAPRNRSGPEEIIEEALLEAKTYRRYGFSTVMIENMHDRPYVMGVGPEVPTLMAIIGREIKKLGLYCGGQILSGSPKETLAFAYSAGLDFIRSEGFVYSHIGDEGTFQSNAGELLRYRKAIGAEDILIYTDIKKKHSSHAITSDVDILETAETAEFFLSDGIVITGPATGKEADLTDLEMIKDISIFKLVGSGITPENLSSYFPLADAFIVGSFFKKEGRWDNELDESRIESMAKAFNLLGKEYPC